MIHKKVFSFAAGAALIFIILLQGCPSGNGQTVSKSQSGNIIVTEPQPGQTVTNSVTVRGRARVEGGVVNIRIKGEDGKELGIVHTQASLGAPDFGDFIAEVSFQKPEGMSGGVVEVFSQSTETGSETDMVQIPVKF